MVKMMADSGEAFKGATLNRLEVVWQDALHSTRPDLIFMSVFVALAVENLDRRLMRGRGHVPSCELTRSLASGGHGSEITEDQGLPGDRTLQCDADSRVRRTPGSLTESSRS